MKIEVWSDYVCPFCYIGKRRLEQALESTGLKEHAEIVFKSYELDPHSPAVSDESLTELLAGKYNKTIEETKDMNQQVVNMAKTVGLDYDFERIKPANTFNAHRLAKFAEKSGKEAELTELLLHSYFIDGKEIGRKEVLVDLAEVVGLNREEVERVMSTDEYAEDVRKDIQEAMQIGVRGVPFFVINQKYAISGAQTAETFEGALRKVAEEEGVKPKLQTFGSDDASMCTDDKCDI